MEKPSTTTFDKRDAALGFPDRTPNPECPACQESRLHSSLETKTHHPLAGCGYTKEQGWTYNKNWEGGNRGV